MRIRQRKGRFPISFLSPIPLSDSHLSRSPVVQLEQHSNPHGNLSQEAPHTAAAFDPQPSDQPNQPIGGQSKGQDSSDASGVREEKKVLLQDGEEKGGEGEMSNDTRKGSFLGAEMQTMILHQSSSSLKGGRLSEGERACPLKKRRGSFEGRSNGETIIEKDKKLKTKMKIKMNKKCVHQIGGEEEEDKETKEGINSSLSVKMRARGGALLQGSRCSRVNGRGWRCCQDTLVGYSLCEHHLGKGRLRSMTNVRKRSMATAAPRKDKSQLVSSPSSLLQEEETKRLSLDDKVGGAYEDDDEKKPSVIAKKKTRLGMVKARSISSLLGQSYNAIAVEENNE